MPLMRWDPFTALARLDDEFDDLVRRSFGSAPYQYVPPVEMSTEGSDVVITLELPGVDVDDIDRDTREETKGKVLVREMRYGAFRRTFQLPDGVTADQVEAEADKGLLRVRVKNVTKPVMPPRKIGIRSESGSQPKTIESKATETK